MIRPSWTIAVLAGATILIVGCSQEARDQYGEAGKNLKQGAQQTGQALSTDAEKSSAAAAKAAQAAGTEVKNAAANTKQASDAALETSKVKTALDTAAGLDTENVNVDTNMDTRTVTLNGAVPDEKQKSQAEQVAKGIAGSEFKVVNNLKIG